MSDILSPQGFEPNETLEDTDIQEVYQPTSGGIRRNKQVTLATLKEFFKKLTSFTANNIVESSADGTLRTTTITTDSVAASILLSASNSNLLTDNINQGVKTTDTPLFEDITLTGMTGTTKSRIEGNASDISSNDTDIGVLTGAVTQNESDISNRVVIGSDAVLNSVKTDNMSLKTKVVSIGAWDMDNTDVVSIIHDLTPSSIRSVNVLIQNDGQDTRHPLDAKVLGYDVSGTWRVSNTGTTVRLERFTGEFFDSSDYDSTAINRGYITIIYEA